jgi:hypothetical protein
VPHHATTGISPWFTSADLHSRVPVSNCADMRPQTPSSSAFAGLAILVLISNPPCSFARPTINGACSNGEDCVLTPWDEAGYLEYVARYNPFNGTNAAFKYTSAQAKAMVKAIAKEQTRLSSSNFGNSTGIKQAKESKFSLACIFYAFGGVSCMYDETARVSWCKARRHA